MRRLIALTLFTLIAISGAAAQQVVDYQIRDIQSQIVGDRLVVSFTVNNVGAAVTVDQTARLFDSAGTELASQTVKPIAANQSIQDIRLSAPVSGFPLGTTQTLCATIGLDQLPPANLRNQFGNIGCISAQVPATLPAAPAQGILPDGFSLASIDLSDPTTLALILGAVVVVLVLIWVITVIVRLLFSRPPTMPAWQAPYVITPLIDPNSTNGRRQLWQQHANSDTLPVPCAPGNYMVRKLLIGSDGAKLKGWRVTGLRISPYDRYGRVGRSQVVLPRKTVKSLDKAARKSPSLDWDHALRAVRPAARGLTAALIKKTNKQNAILPIALDIRFVGLHGEVRILFELYGCTAGAWQEIDQWEPEMRVVNGSIQENFTYTLPGQYPEETGKQFRQRLESDLTHLLAAMVQAPPPLPPAQDTAETAAVTP